jgi:DNA (cytosine-5)-methyltransferase 1
LSYGDDLTYTDMFCGAGGSSIGAEAAGGRLALGLNHWQRAVETHNINFPHADHDCADISQTDPRRYRSTDILMASPECTTHSVARSRKQTGNLFEPPDPALERSRATMWDVPRFAEVHRYKVIVVENVVEIRRWLPYAAWLQAMHAYGYEHKELYLNSMVAHPTPQSRDRTYVVFWRKDLKAPDLDFRPSCWCPTCEADVEGIQTYKRLERPWGKYRQQYFYRCSVCHHQALPYAWPAASAIDWSLPTPRIGDRARPLAPATLRRIRVGLERYGPALIQHGGHTYERPGGDYYRTWPTWGPTPTQLGSAHQGLVMPTTYSHAGARRLRGTEEPLMTQTGRQEQALVVPMRTNGKARPAHEAPLATCTTADGGGSHLVALPFMLSQHDYKGGDEKRVHGLDEPHRTVVAEGLHHALVVPLRRNGHARPDGEPVPTVTADGNHHAIVTRHYTERNPDSAQMSKPVTSPFGTVTGADHHSLTTVPLTVDYHGTGRAHPVDHPLPTQDSRDRHGLVEPAIEVEDCGFRMLEPHEIGRAMAFPDSYQVGGNKRERVRQYGQAVTPPVMQMILERCKEALG